MQMIRLQCQGRFEKKWPAFSALTHQNCVVGKKIATHATAFETFLMWACFWHSLKNFKVGVAHPRCEIGSLSTSPSFGTLIKCVGGLV